MATTAIATDIHPFQVETPQAELDDLAEASLAPGGPTSFREPAGSGEFRFATCRSSPSTGGRTTTGARRRRS
jgi:hypothetical protein